MLTGDDRLEAARLAHSMPHACRALEADAGYPPQSAASTVLGEVLASLVDHLVRTAAEPTGKSPAPVRRAARPVGSRPAIAPMVA